MIDYTPIILSLKLAFVVTIILFVISIPISYWLTYSKFRLKAIAEVAITLPLVLPPSVLGFYLLLAFSPGNSFGKFLEQYFNIRLVFTFEGLVIASVLYSLPFMINPVLSGFRSLPPSLKEASFTLGKSRLTTLTKILLPNIRVSLFTGIVMTFAHTLGEFGVVLMVGGSIPKQTRVVSIAIYDEVESMNYHDANIYSAILLLFAFLILLVVYRVKQRKAFNLLG
ncbi:MAG TPA: molybdate ABC transporter permease subunit [Puia sp.]|nr:molybdate ABC transporter permease subunit [Puia sp.]